MYKVKYWKQDESSVIDALQDWLWPDEDHETWFGIREDWIKSHHEKYFKHLDNFRVAIQAGGCCGVYPRMLAQRFKTVYTFEPVPAAFHCLVNNNQLEKVIKLQIALGDRVGQTALTYINNSVGMSQVNNEVKGMIPMMTIDSFNFQDVDLIALDVEGHEYQALKGAQETIAKWKPVIIIEATNVEKEKLILPHGYEKVDTTGHADTIYKVKKVTKQPWPDTSYNGPSSRD